MNTSEMMKALLQAGDIHQVFRSEIIRVLKYIDPTTGSTFYNGNGQPFLIAYAETSDDDYRQMAGLAIYYTAYLISNSCYEDVRKIVTNCDINMIREVFHAKHNDLCKFDSLLRRIL